MTDETHNETENSTPKIEGVGITHGKVVKTNKSKSKKLIFITLLLVILVLVGGLSSNFLLNRPVCTDDLLKIAGSSIENTRRTQLSDIAKDIKKKPGYEKDANCLYVVLKDSINNTNTSSAVLAFDNLLKVYEKEEGFSPALGKNIDSIEELKRQISFLKLFEENVKSNSSGVKEP